MARPIKFRIVSIDQRHWSSGALRDCTEGNTYEGTLYARGEKDPEGDTSEYPTIVFKDDAGDEVYKYANMGFTYEEVV